MTVREDHTPTPWRVDRDGLQIRAAKAGPLAIASATGGTYAGLSGSGHIDRDTMKANAEFIVTAVNSYASSQAEIERLRAALQPFVDILDLSEANAIKDGRNPETVPDTLDVLAFRDVPGLKLGAFRAARAALSGSKE